MSMASLLRQEIDGITLLRLNRPERRNALDGPAMAALAAELSSDGGPIILTGDSTCFSSGVDIDMIRSDPQASSAALFGLLEAGLTSRRSVIAAVEGRAVGGGWLLCATADLTVASPAACFAAPEVSMGIPAIVAAALLCDALGPALWARGMLAGIELSSHELGAVGAVDIADDPLVHALDQARAFAALDSHAFQATKEFSRRERLARLKQAEIQSIAFLHP
jgi:enoyl-CoA hydratase/carnithine racemase